MSVPAPDTFKGMYPCSALTTPREVHSSGSWCHGIASLNRPPACLPACLPACNKCAGLWSSPVLWGVDELHSSPHPS